MNVARLTLGEATGKAKAEESYEIKSDEGEKETKVIPRRHGMTRLVNIRKVTFSIE